MKVWIYGVVLGVAAGIVAAGVAAHRHFCEYGVYFGRPRPTAKPDDVEAFALEIVRATHVELSCGGCLEDPHGALQILRSRLGRQETVRRCMLVVFSPETPQIRPAVWSAFAVLYQASDARQLPDLLALRARGLAGPEPWRADRQHRLDCLIVGLCEKLGQPPPPGLPALSEHDWHRLNGAPCSKAGCTSTLQ